MSGAWIRPADGTEPIALTVTQANPYTRPAVVVHRGLGGKSQAVWSAAPADAGQTLTHRCPADQVRSVLARLTIGTRVAVTADAGCAVQPMPAAVITSISISYRYDMSPAAADMTIEAVAV